MKITLLTQSSDDFWPIIKLTAPNKLEYCLRWQIQFSLRHLEYLIPEECNRNTVMLETLKECDYLWFMGGDTIIMNQTIDVRTLIDIDYDFIFANDMNGMNNDVFFLRNSKASIEFLETVIYKHHSRICNTDQEAMFLGLDTTPDFRYKRISQRLINAYRYEKDYWMFGNPEGQPNYKVENEYQDGDFIIHFPAMTPAYRLQLCDEYLPKVIR